MTMPASQYPRIPEQGNPARTEAWALLEAARELSQVKRLPLDERRAALRRNWRLWTIFQANLLDPGCTVPTETRRNLLGLANFIDRQTAQLLANGEPDGIDVLININRQISEGLLDGQRATVARVPPQPAPASLSQSI
jgi:flagellar biosynthesis activator protein FlaF